MQELGTWLLAIGIIVAFLAQIAGAIIAFRVSALKGVLSILIPGYLLFVLKREGAYGKVIGSWFAGIVGMVVGGIILS